MVARWIRAQEQSSAQLRFSTLSCSSGRADALLPVPLSRLFEAFRPKISKPWYGQLNVWCTAPQLASQRCTDFGAHLRKQYGRIIGEAGIKAE
jgi:hypothetical protein